MKKTTILLAIISLFLYGCSQSNEQIARENFEESLTEKIKESRGEEAGFEILNFGELDTLTIESHSTGYKNLVEVNYWSNEKEAPKPYVYLVLYDFDYSVIGFTPKPKNKEKVEE